MATSSPVRPVECLITDRRRLADPTPDGIIAQARAASAAGVHLIQLRERDLEGRALIALARRLVATVAGTGTRVIVNDRVDVALAAGAHGVHLRSSSFMAARVRPVVPRGFVIGQSVHHLSDMEPTRLHGVDYLVFGNVFESGSKPGLAPRGLAALAAVARATPVPVLAVGGITRERVPSLMDAGAAGVAAIGMYGDSR